MRLGVNRHSSAKLPLGKETQCPFYRKLCGLQGPYGRLQNILPSMGFNPRTFQPVGSRHIDYTIANINVIVQIDFK